MNHKNSLQLLSVVLLALLFFTATGISCEDELRSPKMLFKEFAAKFNKYYTSDEEYEQRAAIFADNLQIIQKLNKEHGGELVFSHLTPFMDLSVQEFKNRYLMQPQHYTQKDFIPQQEQQRHASSSKNYKKPVSLPQSFDWRDKGAVTPVKNQASCGSCWAFSAVQAIESQHYLAGNPLTELSVQQLVDCDTKDCGCFGGWYFHAWEYLLESNKGGIATERDYKYCIPTLGTCYPCNTNPQLCPTPSYCNHTCNANAPSAVFITGYENVTSHDEDVIAQALMDHGPLSIALNAIWLQFYHSGVSDPLYCPGDLYSLDHAVLLVGFGTRKNMLGHEQKYWIIKNSWGESWGMKGYFELARGKSKCGVNQLVSFPKVK